MSKENTEKTDKKEELTEIIAHTETPMVFISHDTRDAEITEAFSKLLSSVSAGVLKSFRSSDKKGTQGIEYGIEWYPQILKKLQAASDVVCLLTEHSINRPWILFEAGMAKGKLDTSILGIAIGVPLSKASTGPFAQFQNSDDDEDSLTKLVMQLVKKIPNAEPDEDVIRVQVQKFKGNVDEILKKRTENNDTVEIQEDSAAKLFEEVKIMFKELPSRIERNINLSEKKPLRDFHAGFFDDLAHFNKDFEPKIGIKILLSPIKDSIPWIYDAGIDAIEKIEKSKTLNASEKTIRNFMRLFEFSIEHPVMRDIHFRRESDFRYYRELLPAVYDYLKWVSHNKGNDLL